MLKFLLWILGPATALMAIVFLANRLAPVPLPSRQDDSHPVTITTQIPSPQNPAERPSPQTPATHNTQPLAALTLKDVRDFELPGSDGKHFHSKVLNGKYWVASIFFTRCSGTCLQMTNALKTLNAMLQPEEELHFVSFSMDTEFDTPAVLTDYAAKWNAVTPRWHFLTGNGELIKSIAVNDLQLSAQEGIDGDPNSIIHSSRLVLIDRKMRVRAYYDGRDLGEVRRLLGEFRKLRGGDESQRYASDAH